MTSTPQESETSNAFPLWLDGSIQLLDIASSVCSFAPAQVALGSACALLKMIKDTKDNEEDFIYLGQSCARVCEALDRGLAGTRPGELGGSVHGAIQLLTTTIARIQKKIQKKGKRKCIFKWLSAKGDKDAITAWNRDLDRVLDVFNVELLLNTTRGINRVQVDVLKIQGGATPIPNIIPPGELPPPAPKAFFGRDGLIEEIIGRVERLESFALIGAGGIGKTSIALTVLHDDRIKNRFEDNRRFISCDKFPPSRVHFLACISKVIGAGVENPEDLASLRHALSSKDMLLILDNAESILDPQGTDAREIYAMVKELSDFSNICLGVTSRISTVPPHCKRLEIPTLSMDAARDIFDSIYGDGGRSNIIDDLLCRLDFHALSVTLLATTASSNMWDHDRLIKEWDEHHAQVLRTDHDDGLAVTVELSLASPTFRKLGSIARDLLEVVAFFPQGVAEKNLEWFFPTIPDRKHIFDKFCVLSLAHRNGGFITMLAPIRDYLSPQDPKSSPHLGATKDWYFAQLSVDLHPGRPGFREAEWIKSEDVNVEHLLNVFASFDTGAFDVWNPCAQFMEHLYWHKPRHTVLKSKIEGLPDNHRSKSRCLFELSQLLGSVGNHAEQKRLLTHSLALEREARDNSRVAQILRSLSSSNLILGLHEEGMQQAREALEMYKQSGDTVGQAWCLYNIAWLFLQAGQPSAAENMALHAIDFLPEQGEEYLLCKSHRVLGVIYDSIATGGKGRAVDRFEAALGIASPFGWRSELFSVYYALANLSFAGAKFDDATSHITRAKSYAVDDAYDLGLAMEMQASIWYPQRRLEDARSEALRALEIYEKLGAEQDIGICRRLLQRIEQAMENKPSSSTLDMDLRPSRIAIHVARSSSPDVPDKYCIPERGIARSLFPKRVL